MVNTDVPCTLARCVANQPMEFHSINKSFSGIPIIRFKFLNRNSEDFRLGDFQFTGTVNTRIIQKYDEPPASVSSRRRLNSRELAQADNLFMDFAGLEFMLRDTMREQNITAPPIDAFLNMKAENIRQIIDLLPSRSATIDLLARLIPLFDQYLNLIRGSGMILRVIASDENLNVQYRRFIITLGQVRNFAGISSALIEQANIEREAAEQREREEEAAQWVNEIVPNRNSPTSRISVGELSGVWRIFKIHRDGEIYAINEDSLQVTTFTPNQWYNQRGIARIVASFAWLDVLRQSRILQFLVGLFEGFGRSALSLVEAIVRIDQTLRTIYQALTNIGETGRAIWLAILEWKDRFVRSSDIRRARMIGVLIGSLLFEIVLTRGAGRLAVITRANEALHALRSGSLAIVRRTVTRLGEGVRSAGRLAGGVAGAVERLRIMGLIRNVSNVLRNALEAARGTLQIAGSTLSGALYVTREAFYFLFDGARDVITYIGRSLDDWAWGRRNGFCAVSSIGAGHLDDLAADLYQWLSTRQARSTTSAGITAGARGFARLSPQAQNWLMRQFGSEGLQHPRIIGSLSRAGDDIIETINRFHTVDGFEEVLRDFAIRRSHWQQGARYVMRFARAELSDRVGTTAMRFEFPSGRGTRITGQAREVDIFASGIRYELKSVLEINPGVIRNQLIPDLIQHMGSDLSNLQNLRWLFDSQRIGISRTQAVQRIQSLVQQYRLLQGHQRMPEILNAIEHIIVFWP